MLCQKNYLAGSDFQKFFLNKSTWSRDFRKIIGENRKKIYALPRAFDNFKENRQRRSLPPALCDLRSEIFTGPE